MYIEYDSTISEGDKKVLDKFAKEEYDRLPALPIATVVELPNSHRFTYVPEYSEELKDYVFRFERITRWPN